MENTIHFYENKMGFEKVFDSMQYEDKPINYAVLCRQNICIHFQLFDRIDDIKMPQFRIQVKDIEFLFEEYKSRKTIDSVAELRATPWGTRGFAFFDPNSVGLTFFESISQ